MISLLIRLIYDIKNGNFKNEDRAVTHSILFHLVSWTYLMHFNITKCKIICLRTRNACQIYTTRNVMITKMIYGSYQITNLVSPHCDVSANVNFGYINRIVVMLPFI